MNTTALVLYLFFQNGMVYHAPVIYYESKPACQEQVARFSPTFAQVPGLTPKHFCALVAPKSETIEEEDCDA